MHMYNEVERRFAHRSVGTGKTIVLASPVAIEMIEACSDAGFRILGLDAFRKVGERIQPIIEESVDFTTQYRKETDSWGEARAFIEKRIERCFYFEVVCDG